MRRVYYFSATGRTGTVAQYFAQRLECEPVAIEDGLTPDTCGTAVVVFPVYCQNIPRPVTDFLRRLTAENVVLIAAYGRMSFGNVIAEASRLVCGRVIAAACVPIGHSYLREETDFDPSPLEPLFERISQPAEAKLSDGRKDLFADLAPLMRSQLGVKLKKIDSCTRCGVCTAQCPESAMLDGVAGSRCMRCLRCVAVCPEKALDFELSLPVRLYLRKKRMTDTVLYL